MKNSVFALLFIISLFGCEAPINENRKQLLETNHSENIKQQIRKKTVKSRPKPKHPMYMEGTIYNLKNGEAKIFVDSNKRGIDANKLEDSTLVTNLRRTWGEWNNTIIINNSLYQGKDYKSICHPFMTGDISKLKHLEGYSVKTNGSDRLTIMKGEAIILDATEIEKRAIKPPCFRLK